LALPLSTEGTKEPKGRKKVKGEGRIVRWLSNGLAHFFGGLEK